MRTNIWKLICVGLCILIPSLIVYGWVLSGSRFVCTPPTSVQAENYAKATASMNEVVDLGIKLSTTLAGLGAALLLGLKEGLSLTSVVKFFVLLGTILFVESALYAIWWRTGVAEMWLNGCPSLIAESRLLYRFDAHLGLFVAGLISLGCVVVSALFFPKKSEDAGEVT